MKTTYKRYKREIALLLIVAMALAMIGCKKKKAGTDTVLSILSSETETSPEETTSESTSETTSEATTSTVPSENTTETTPEETSETVPSESATEPSESSDSTATPTEKPKDPTPTSTSTPKPTKAPKETKKADPTPTTPPTNTPTSTSTPTSAPATPTTQPTTAITVPDPNLSKSTAVKAMKAAVQDYCGSHSFSYTDQSGQNVTIPFQFNDAVMKSAQVRADNYASTGTLTHSEISGSMICMEACSTMTCEPVYNNGNPYWEYSWTDDAGTRHSYDNLYDAMYASAVYDITQHSPKLSSQSNIVCYGVGFSVRPVSFDTDIWLINYGIANCKTYYKFGTYICGCDESDISYYGFSYTTA